MSGKVKKKNNLSYISWAAAWAEIKKHHPDATYRDYECCDYMPREVERTKYDADGNMIETERVYRNVPTRFWFDDGNTGWVKVSVTIGGIEHIENYPIMDHKNQPIPADKITSTDANKAKMRALAKACAKHGLGLYIYEGEDIPENAKKELTALAVARNNVIKVAQSATKRGVDREKIYVMIADKNGGVNDPKKIASVKICDELVAAINQMKK